MQKFTQFDYRKVLRAKKVTVKAITQGKKSQSSLGALCQPASRTRQGYKELRCKPLKPLKDFTLTVTKDDETTRAKEHRSGHRDFIDIGIATEMSREASLLGSCIQVPVDLGYAVTIHKGQGLTIRKDSQGTRFT